MKGCLMLIIGLIALSLLYSCEGKEGITVVEGVLTDSDNNPISNHPVRLTSNRRELLGLGVDLNAESSLNTKNDGDFSFSFDANKDYSYKVIAEETNCYFEKKSDIREAEPNSIELSLEKKGVIRLRYNENLLGDSIHYKLSSENGGYLYSTNYKITDFHIGRYVLNQSVGTNQKTILEWSIYNNNIVIEGSQILQAIQCDSIDFEIMK